MSQRGSAGRPLPPMADAPGSPLYEERARARSEQGTLDRARRRQAVIFGMLALALVGLLGRTAYWQIAEHGALASRADAEHLRALKTLTGRGAIFDANGKLLALSVTEDAVIADPNVIRSSRALDTTAQQLSAVLGLPQGLARGQLDVAGAYVRLHDADGVTILATPQQSDTLAAAIAAGALPGVALIPVVQRVYPNGSLAAQALGFVRTSDGVGQYGVEQRYQGMLAGKPGLLYTAVDAQGNPLATAPQRQTAATPGAAVTLTLDANVQYWAEQGLAQAVAQTGADGGSVIALDPATGALIALANWPGFDPNSYGSAALDSFTDPAVSAVYDPGSTMKAITMAAGVEDGAITPQTTFDDSGGITVDGVNLHNWDRRGYGQITMTQVLQYSANTGAVWVEQRVGGARFAQYLSAFGFGKRSGVDLPAESAGILAHTSSSGDAALTLAENAFGESIGVTPLQMAMAYAALANGGTLMRPYIVASVTGDNGQGAVTRFGPQVARQVMSGATARTVTQMLVDSAYASEAQMSLLPGYAVAAKTGTSTPNAADPQVTYASVIGYAPATHPRFVLLVKLDHPKTTIYGGSAAGPLWRTLARQLFTYYQIPPEAPHAATPSA